MKTKRVWANLSSEDVERTHEFYKALGFRTNGEFPNKFELASFLVGEDDFVVKKEGGTLFSKPQKIQGNWYGCGFADPDGHKWNVFYNGKK